MALVDTSIKKVNQFLVSSSWFSRFETRNREPGTILFS